MKIGAKIKLMNHNFYQAMLDNGYKNAAEFSKKSRIHQTVIGRYINLHDFPKRKKVIVRLEKLLHIPIEELFPDELIEQIKKKYPTIKYVSSEVKTISLGKNELKQLEEKAVEEYHENEILEENKDKIKKIMNLKILNQREKKILTLKHGLENGKELTYREIGKIFNLTGGRIQQLYNNAIRKLHIPHIQKKIGKDS